MTPRFFKTVSGILECQKAGKIIRDGKVVWGWSEQDEENPWNKDEMVHRYYISTAGWSGNESIIKAMEKNDMLWSIHWYQSNRGGHYIFEVKKEEEN